jgi:Holliday junction resolvasome RuvABC endonuclease subunit
MIALGIDPDTKATGIAVVSIGAVPKVLYVATVPVKASLSVEERIRIMNFALSMGIGSLPFGIAVERIAVEGQEKYPRDRVRPNDLIHLAQVSGMASAHAQQHYPLAPLWIPTPRTWKGQVTKNVHQTRILARLGLSEKLEGVEGAGSMNKTQRGHVIDAIGLALWVATIPVKKAKALPK